MVDVPGDLAITRNDLLDTPMARTAAPTSLSPVRATYPRSDWRRHPSRRTGKGRSVEEQAWHDRFFEGDGLMPSQGYQNNLLQKPSPSFLSFSFLRTSTFDMSS